MDPLFVTTLLLFNIGGARKKSLFFFLFFLYSKEAFNKAAYFVDPWLLRPDSSVVRAPCYTSTGNRVLI